MCMFIIISLYYLSIYGIFFKGRGIGGRRTGKTWRVWGMDDSSEVIQLENIKALHSVQTGTEDSVGLVG